MPDVNADHLTILAQNLQREFYDIFKVKMSRCLSSVKPLPTRLNIGQKDFSFQSWNKISVPCTPSLFESLFPMSESCLQLQPLPHFRPKSNVTIRCISAKSAPVMFGCVFVRRWTKEEAGVAYTYDISLSSPIYVHFYNSARRHAVQISFTQKVMLTCEADGEQVELDQIRAWSLRTGSNNPAFKRRK